MNKYLSKSLISHSGLGIKIAYLLNMKITILLASFLFFSNLLAQTKHDTYSSEQEDALRSQRGNQLVNSHANYVNEITLALGIDKSLFSHVLNVQKTYTDHSDELDDGQAKALNLEIDNYLNQLENWNNRYYDTLKMNRDCDDISMENVIAPKGKNSIADSFFKRNHFYTSLGPAQIQAPLFVKLIVYSRDNPEIINHEFLRDEETKRIVDKFLYLNFYEYKDVLFSLQDVKMSLLALAVEIRMYIDFYKQAGIDLSKNTKKNRNALWFLHKAGYGQHRARYRKCILEECGVELPLE